MNWFRRMVKRVCVFFIHLLYPCKVYGKENMPQGRAVIVCNHYRIIDVSAMLRLFKGDVYFLAKKESFENKFAGRFLKNYGCIPIDRNNVELKTIMDCIRVLKNDKKLVVFPEGTRNKVNEELQEIKGGAVVFATKTNSPVIPMMYAHKEKIFKRSRLIIGKPIDLSQYNGKKLTNVEIDEITLKMKNEMINLREQFLKDLEKGK